MPLYDIEVQVSDGNAFVIMGQVRYALRKAGASKEQIEEYTNESTSGDYDHLLQTAMKYVNIYI